MSSEVAYLVYGNHGYNPTSLEDFFCLFKDYFEANGVKTRLSHFPVAGNLNVLIEGFLDSNFNSNMLAALAQDPKTRLICVTTELATDGTFNDEASLKMNGLRRKLRRFLRRPLPSRVQSAYMRRVLRKDTHYGSQFSYWQNRYDMFKKYSQYFYQVWCLNEPQVKGYSEIVSLEKIRVIPLVPFAKNPCIDQPVDEEKDLDFLFTGTITQYRKAVIEQLKARGYKVAVGTTEWGSFLREHHIRRAKICLDLRQSPAWGTPSPMRLYRLLMSGSAVISEHGGVHCKEQNFVWTSSSQKLLETCVEKIKSSNFSQLGRQQLEQYSRAFEADRKKISDLIKESVQF